MARTIGIGNQDFETIRQEGYFYIDKTSLICRWWESGDGVTLITRPRRFGKTLNMSMLEKFFSAVYHGREDLFQGLDVWKSEKYRNLQGTYPVVFISFAGVKDCTFAGAREGMCRMIEEQFNKYDYLLAGHLLNEKEKLFYQSVTADMSDNTAAVSLRALSDFLSRYYGKKTIIFLDEYDAPMQEAYANGYWKEMVSFTRGLFNNTFKSNPYLERAIMTGITRVSKESVFSDLNNLEVVTTTSEKYSDCFGFTEEEVFTALEEYHLSDQKQKVKDWYDGFTFGNRSDIYNPWSIINFLDKRKVGAYWANTSSNSLIGQLVREGSPDIKMTMEQLLHGDTFHTSLDEQIVFSQLDQGDDAVWSLLLASGYLKVIRCEFDMNRGKAEYDLKLTNLEVQIMFKQMIESWFNSCRRVNNAFLQALLSGEIKAMNTYMNKVTKEMFSYFDTGKKPSEEEPERFYHGFVLGLMVELSDRYVVTSNRESGFGRYDVMLEPKAIPGTTSLAAENAMNAIIIEFKVQDEDEPELSDTVLSALRQIEEKDYQAALIARGIPEERIRKYGFAFCGKKVLIDGEGIKKRR